MLFENVAVAASKHVATNEVAELEAELAAKRAAGGSPDELAAVEEKLHHEIETPLRATLAGVAAERRAVSQQWHRRMEWAVAPRR